MVSAIILAAGSGARFGRPKQFEMLDHMRLVDHVVATASAVAQAVVLVIPSGVTWDGAPVYAVVPGGPTRSASVRAGLSVLPSDTHVVVIHDAAHPLASQRLFGAVIERVRGAAEAAVPVVSIAETVARSEGDRLVGIVSDQRATVLVQTPQAIQAVVLREIYAGGVDARDEATLLVQTGRRVATVPGDPMNIHIALPEDLDMARALLQQAD
jgi:2-C-methyl-D-erythritol 4-phosphate cytidylyltransferase